MSIAFTSNLDIGPFLPTDLNTSLGGKPNSLASASDNFCNVLTF